MATERGGTVCQNYNVDARPVSIPLESKTFLVLAEFEQVFGMGVVAFSELPSWKRTKARKTAGLF